MRLGLCQVFIVRGNIFTETFTLKPLPWASKYVTAVTLVPLTQ